MLSEVSVLLRPTHSFLMSPGMACVSMHEYVCVCLYTNVNVHLCVSVSACMSAAITLAR